MPRQKTIKEDSDKVVTHAELRVLVEHISTLVAAQDVRLSACEAALPVDPSVKADAAAFVLAGNAPPERELRLVPKVIIEPSSPESA